MPQALRWSGYVPPKMNVLEYDSGVAVQNSWYTALQKGNLEIYGLCIIITVSDETVEARLTIDGEVLEMAVGKDLLAAGNMLIGLTGVRINNAIKYLVFTDPTVSFDIINSDTGDISFWCKGRNIKLEVRKTTAAGASHILVRGLYGQW